MPSSEQLAEVAEKINAQVVPDEPEKPEPEKVEPEKVEPEKAEQPEEPQETEIEQRARQDGWVPKEEWTGDPEKWVEAERFNERGEYIDKIKSYGRQIKDLSHAVDDLKQLSQRQADVIRKQYETGFTEQRRQAIEVGDVDAVERLDQQQQEFNATLDSKTRPDDTPTEIKSWYEERSWMHQQSPEFDPAAAQAAIAKYGQFEAQGVAPSEALQKTDDYMKKRYPDLYGIEPQGRKPNRVESPTPRTQARRVERGFKDLPEEVRTVAARMERLKVMGRDEYAKQYFESFGD